MTRRSLTITLILAVAAAAGWALAQQGGQPEVKGKPPDPGRLFDFIAKGRPSIPLAELAANPRMAGLAQYAKDKGLTEINRESFTAYWEWRRGQAGGPDGGSEAHPGTPPATPGRYAVAVSGPSGVLLDTATGKTWVLQRQADGRRVWLPARRLDSERDVRQWQQDEEKRGAAATDQEKARERATEAARQEQRRAYQEQREQALRALEEAKRRLKSLEPRPPSELPK